MAARRTPLACLGPQQPHDQLHPLHLAPRVLVVELRPRPPGLQAAVLGGVEQPLEVEARRPLVFGPQDRLGVIQADPPDVLGEVAVGSDQVFRGGAQPMVRRFDLLDGPPRRKGDEAAAARVRAAGMVRSLVRGQRGGRLQLPGRLHRVGGRGVPPCSRIWPTPPSRSSRGRAGYLSGSRPGHCGTPWRGRGRASQTRAGAPLRRG
jgi:hypothetical protein